jgi:hypothetical protein
VKILRVSAAFQARVDRVLATMDATAQRVRRIPIDCIALAVASDLAHGKAAETDAGIRASLDDILRRNHLRRSDHTPTLTI